MKLVVFTVYCRHVAETKGKTCFKPFIVPFSKLCNHCNCKQQINYVFLSIQHVTITGLVICFKIPVNLANFSSYCFALQNSKSSSYTQFQCLITLKCPDSSYTNRFHGGKKGNFSRICILKFLIGEWVWTDTEYPRFRLHV